ncbi:MAG: BrnA antitoxin family protein [Alphaproteobacteria bacterium]|nr:BrnA antitoxin family protein [Alphaproteobacteria bacterium]
MKQGKGENAPKLIVHLDNGTMLRRLDNGTYEPIEPGEQIETTEAAHHEQRRPRKKSLTLRIDEDLLEGFKAQGKGWQTLMHSILRAYFEKHIRS